MDAITALDAEHGSPSVSRGAGRAGLSRATARRLRLSLGEWVTSASTVETSP